MIMVVVTLIASGCDSQHVSPSHITGRVVMCSSFMAALFISVCVAAPGESLHIILMLVLTMYSSSFVSYQS